MKGKTEKKFGKEMQRIVKILQPPAMRPMPATLEAIAFHLLEVRDSAKVLVLLLDKLLSLEPGKSVNAADILNELDVRVYTELRYHVAHLRRPLNRYLDTILRDK